jgi:hypothetical protein
MAASAGAACDAQDRELGYFSTEAEAIAALQSATAFATQLGNTKADETERRGLEL